MNHLLIPTLLLCLAVAIAACQAAASGPSACPLSEVRELPPSVKIGFAPDFTGSAEETVTPWLRYVHLEPLIELLKVIGGEIAVGPIKDRSKPLIRLLVDRPPVRPLAPLETSDPFRDLDCKAEYEERLDDYDEKLAAWKTAADEVISAFETELTPVLAERREGRTNVFDSIRRMDLFLAESDTVWHAPTDKWLVVVSDGIDNIGAPVVNELVSGASVIVVNGSAKFGVVKRLMPERMESIDAAVRHIVESQGVGQ